MTASRVKPDNTTTAELRPRLQKVLAQAGLGSRRACEQLILDGRVEINKHTVTELGVRVDPQKQFIRVDGEPLKIARRQYYLLHKPVGVVTTNRDPARRPRVIDLVPGGEAMFAVGRLDLSSSGLILITNDGDFANQIAHPRYGVEKTYRVTVAGVPPKLELEQLRRGVHLAEGPVRVVSVKVKSQTKTRTVLEVVLNEGRNRELRRMFARLGNKVLSLHRIAIGPVRLGDVPVGAYRSLTNEEVRGLLGKVSSRARRLVPRAGGPVEQHRKRLAKTSKRRNTKSLEASRGRAPSAVKPGKKAKGAKRPFRNR